MANTESEVVDTQENAVEKLKLDVKIDSPSTCLRHVVVTIPREEIDRYHVRAFDELRPRAELPGFPPRKGASKTIGVAIQRSLGRASEKWIGHG